jgi:hypothetical protein
MSARAVVVAALLGLGCQAEVPASLLLTLTSAGEAPAQLRLSVFDGRGQAHDQKQFDAPAAARSNLGTLVVYPRAGGSMSLRVQAAGLRDEQVVSMGAISVQLTAGKQVTATLSLAPAGEAADRDGDGVLDQIDNCPGQANPGQQDATEDGTGDDCGGGPDAAANDATTDAEPGPDGGGARALGAACTDGSQCGTGFCVDGLCCESACRDVCRACNLPDMGGQCAAIPAGAPDRRGGCVAQGPDTCGLDRPVARLVTSGRCPRPATATAAVARPTPSPAPRLPAPPASARPPARPRPTAPRASPATTARAARSRWGRPARPAANASPPTASTASVATPAIAPAPAGRATSSAPPAPAGTCPTTPTPAPPAARPNRWPPAAAPASATAPAAASCTPRPPPAAHAAAPPPSRR